MIRVAAAILLAASITHARSMSVETFHADVEVLADGSVEVEERLRVRFKGRWNGIYRYIPYKFRYPNGLRGNIRLTVLGVSGDTEWFKEKREDGNVFLRIKVRGAVNATREIVIRYRLQRVIMTYDDEDELYWNVTGNGWITWIKHATATVRLPATVPLGSVRMRAFKGRYGASAEAKMRQEGNTYICEARTLGPHQGLTFALRFPVGHVEHPGLATRVGWFFQDNWPFLLPLLALAAWIVIWWRHGRDRRYGPVVAEWRAPDDLTPAEVGVVADERLHDHDITATIVDLARRGYLRIEQNGDGYRLHRAKDADDGLRDFEKEVYDALLGTSDSRALSSRRSSIYRVREAIVKMVGTALVKKRLFNAVPAGVRMLWYVITFFALAGLVAVGVIVGVSPLYYGALFPIGIVMFLFASYMPKRTKKGSEAWRRVKGMEEYISTAERAQLQTMDPDHFERLLPYAIALGLHREWVRVCAGLFMVPGWYEGREFAPHHFLRSVRSTAYAAPRTESSGGGGWSGGSGFSSGGGFSGGGFGGGGGGGW